MPVPSTKFIGFAVDPKLKQAVVALARHRGVSVAEAARSLLVAGLRTRYGGEANPFDTENPKQ